MPGDSFNSTTDPVSIPIDDPSNPSAEPTTTAHHPADREEGPFVDGPEPFAEIDHGGSASGPGGPDMSAGFLWHRTLAGRGTLLIMAMLFAGAAALMGIMHDLQHDLFEDLIRDGAVIHGVGIAQQFEERVANTDVAGSQRDAKDIIDRWAVGVVGLRVIDANGLPMVEATADGFEGVLQEMATTTSDLPAPDGEVAIEERWPYILATAPIVSKDGASVTGRVDIVYESASTFRAEKQLYAKSWIVAIAMIVAVSIAIGLVMQRMVSRPISRTITAMNAVAEDRLDVRIPSGSVVELKRMGAALEVFQSKVSERLDYARRSAAAEAAAGRAESDRAREQAEAERQRLREEAEKRAADETIRLREQALIDDLRRVVKGAAEGDFGIRMGDTDGESDIPRHVNGLLETVGDGVDAVTRVFSRLAGGEVSARMDGTYTGAFARLQTEVNAAASQLDEALGEIFTRATDVLGDSSDLSEAATELSNRTERTAHTVAETTASLEMMVTSIANTARLAGEARESAVETEREAHDSDAVVKDAIAGMEAIEELSVKIGKTLDIIDDIAFQTNLLALNAGVEAARAGQAGRGFAIVASEVRALAGKVAEAAQQIGTLVNESSDRIKDGVGRVGRTGETLDALGHRIRRIGVQIDEIADAAVAQSDSAAEMNEAMSRIDDATQQNAAMFEETTAANLSLNNAASRMLGLVSGFKTSETAGRAEWDASNRAGAGNVRTAG